MFDRFTDGARKAMGFARQEALHLNHDFIGPEHILLGLIQEGSGVAADILKNIDVDPKKIRQTDEEDAEPTAAPSETKSKRPALDAVDHELTELVPQELVAEVDVFERFSESAKKAMGVAWQEARRLRHASIAPEHLLLALAGELSPRLGLDPKRVRTEVEEHLEPGDTPFSMKELPFTPAALGVLELTLEAAREFGHETIGPPHLLVGLLREGESVAARVLREPGVTLEDAVRLARKG